MTSCETSHIKRGKLPVIVIWMLVTCTLILGLSLQFLFAATSSMYQELVSGTCPIGHSTIASCALALEEVYGRLSLSILYNIILLYQTEIRLYLPFSD